MSNGYHDAKIENLETDMEKIEDRFTRLDNKVTIIIIILAAVAGEAGIGLIRSII